jgi:hypothetical protein
MMRLDQFLFAALIVGAVCAAEWRMSIGVDVQDYENVQNFFLCSSAAHRNVSLCTKRASKFYR